MPSIQIRGVACDGSHRFRILVLPLVHGSSDNFGFSPRRNIMTTTRTPGITALADGRRIRRFASQSNAVRQRRMQNNAATFSYMNGRIRSLERVSRRRDHFVVEFVVRGAWLIALFAT